jgi:hypothetical protein
LIGITTAVGRSSPVSHQQACAVEPASSVWRLICPGARHYPPPRRAGVEGEEVSLQRVKRVLADFGYFLMAGLMLWTVITGQLSDRSSNCRAPLESTMRESRADLVIMDTSWFSFALSCEKE